MKTPKLYAALLTAGLSLATMTSCDPSQMNAQLGLQGLLNSEEGQRMTADELANIGSKGSDKIRNAAFEVHLPVTKADTRPAEGKAYLCRDDSTTLVFKEETPLSSPEGDISAEESLPPSGGNGGGAVSPPIPANTIGTLSAEWYQTIWGESFSTDKAPSHESYYVQSRGKGIYTLWKPEPQYQNGHPVINEQGDTLKAVQFEGMLVFVYPGADSLIITRGTKATEHIYTLK